jgi:hypothetical protein
MTSGTKISIAFVAALVIATAVYFIFFHGRIPDPPDAKQFAAMTEEQQCDAVLPRTTPCASELIAASLLSITTGDDPEMQKLARDLAEQPGTKDEDRAIAKTQCVADRGFPAAVVACWKVEDCKPFSECIYKTIAAEKKR